MLIIKIRRSLVLCYATDKIIIGSYDFGIANYTAAEA